ncbi:MAG: M60 family metallopeptidase, partial [Phycisphaerales bacterium]|nr:M60 family metallopeptidase [Phycisphaerales bacterium]
MKRSPLASTALTLALFLAPTYAEDIPVDDLLRNVEAIASGGNPAAMITWDEARPLVVAPDGTIFAAATRMGRGRIIVLGHGGFTQTDEADAEVFGANAVAWLGGHANRRDAIRVFGLTDPIEAECARRAVSVERIRGNLDALDLDTVDVIIGSPQGFEKAGRLDDLERWIRRGGGLLLTETAWGQLQLNPGLTIDDLAANHLLADAGVRFTSGAHSGFGPDGTYPVRGDLLVLANADRGLEVLAGEREGDVKLAARVVGNAFGAVPLNSTLIRRADALARQHADEIAAAYAGLPDTRITPEKQPLARALFDLDARRAMELPPDRLRAHPSSHAFPGPVGSARVDHVRLEIDAAVPGWHSTGLYAPPGEVVRVRIPAAAGSAGDLTVQIGAWLDQHEHPYRVRMRSAMRRYPVTGATTLVASSIGGPIYIDVPRGFAAEGPLTVEIDRACRAPHYVLGVTDLDEWRETIRHYEAPWAEMESGELIFTVPSDAIRDLERPDLAMQHWNRVHEAMQSLEPRTSNHWADRPYRYVADASVSYGYMYCPADAPIVIPVSEAAPMFDLANFDAEGPNQLWGHYHEMG